MSVVLHLAWTPSEDSRSRRRCASTAAPTGERAVSGAANPSCPKHVIQGRPAARDADELAEAGKHDGRRCDAAAMGTVGLTALTFRIMGARSLYRQRPVGLAVLASSVACVWVRSVPDEAGVSALVVPDGCVDLIWMDGRLQVVGPDTRPRDVSLSPATTISGIRLRPGAAPLLAGDMPASALTDVQVDLAELWGAEAYPLVEELVAGSDATAVLAGAVATRLARYAPDPLVMTAARMLDRAGPPSVPQLAVHLGISERQLRRRMVDAVGYGPKVLEQVLRFGRARRAAADGTDLARVAADEGYADQAHMSREVRRWAGRPITGLGDSRPEGSAASRSSRRGGPPTRSSAPSGAS
ncbi:MAG: helix-turn-helix transcriptional regulator [Hamadaea sp.]|nr:helix-turn-helix transcriptional regulator [Hamadaea sp.]